MIMKSLNQVLKQDAELLKKAKYMWGGVVALEGDLCPATRIMVAKGVRNINTSFYLEITAKLRALVAEAGVELAGPMTELQFDNRVKRKLKLLHTGRVIHYEHVNGGVKWMVDFIINNWQRWTSPQVLLDWIVDNTCYVARHIDEKHLDESTTIAELAQYL